MSLTASTHYRLVVDGKAEFSAHVTEEDAREAAEHEAKKHPGKFVIVYKSVAKYISPPEVEITEYI